MSLVYQSNLQTRNLDLVDHDPALVFAVFLLVNPALEN